MNSILQYVMYLLLLTFVFINAVKKYYVRLILFCCLLFMFFISPYVYALQFFGGRPRLPIGVLLLIAGWTEIRNTLKELNNQHIIIPLVLWILYTAFSAIFIAHASNISLLYQQIGDMIVYVLIATYISKSTHKELVIILSTIVLAQLVNLVVYAPRVFPVLDFIPIYQEYHHGEAGIASLKMIPILLFMLYYIRIRSIKATITVLILFACSMAFLSGSRTAMLGIIVFFVLYKPSIKRLILIIILSIPAIILVKNTTDTSWGTERTVRLFEGFRSRAPMSLGEVEFRTNQMHAGFEIFKRYPIMGAGYGSWHYMQSNEFTYFGFQLSSHNAYALLLSETGMIGVVLFYLMLYYSLRGIPYKACESSKNNLCFIMLVTIITFLLLGYNSSLFWHRDFIMYLGITGGAKIRRLHFSA